MVTCVLARTRAYIWVPNDRLLTWDILCEMCPSNIVICIFYLLKFVYVTLLVQWRPFITRFIIANILSSSILISLHNMLPFELTKDTPYLALSGELWSVFYEYFNRNWSCYKGFPLYMLYVIFRRLLQTGIFQSTFQSHVSMEKM